MRILSYIYTRVRAWLHRIGRLAFSPLLTSRQRIRGSLGSPSPRIGRVTRRLRALRQRLEGLAAALCPARFFFGPYAHGPPLRKSKMEERTAQQAVHGARSFRFARLVLA
jgi:hypothetical protein